MGLRTFDFLVAVDGSATFAIQFEDAMTTRRKYRPRSTPKKERMVRSVIDAQCFEAFEALHQREGETQSSFIRRLIMRAINEHEHQLQAA